jgi:hypothetical protein
MNSTVYAELVHNTRYPELLEEAAARRLRESVRPQGPKGTGSFRNTMGQVLIRAGRRLQTAAPEVAVAAAK